MNCNRKKGINVLERFVAGSWPTFQRSSWFSYEANFYRIKPVYVLRCEFKILAYMCAFLRRRVFKNRIASTAIKSEIVLEQCGFITELCVQDIRKKGANSVDPDGFTMFAQACLFDYFELIGLMRYWEYLALFCN